MDKEIIRLLKSGDPSDRMDGIKRLADSGHPDTLKILGSLYKKEIDPDVKELVAEVARELKSGKSSDSEKPVRRNPSAARSHLEKALSAMMDFKNDEAWVHARKAFMADPELANDDYAIGVAAEITGKDNATAVEMLLASSQSPEDPEKPKRDGKAKRDDNERVGWGKALAGIGVYSFLMSLGAAIPMLIFSSVVFSMMAILDPSSANVAGTTFYGITAVVAFSMIILTFIGILIQYSLIHFSATTFLGGDGYFTNLLWNMRIPLIAQFLVQALIIGIMMFMLSSALLSLSSNSLEAFGQTGDLRYIPGLEEKLNVMQGLNALNGLVSLGFIIWSSMVIGKTYDFGGVKGCLSLIISNIIMGVAICGCYFVFIMAFAGMAGY